MDKEYSVYIMSSKARTMYVGVTNNLYSRVWEHKTYKNIGFTSMYNCTRLVYFENYPSITDAIDREKQLKKWRRDKKIILIKSQNPKWNDLSDGWYES